MPNLSWLDQKDARDLTDMDIKPSMTQAPASGDRLQ